MIGRPWHLAPLVALDLEGSGAQDRDNEAILEIATVPVTNGQPDVGDAYCTLINPERSIPARPWTSQGLTNDTLRAAPTLATVQPILGRYLNGRYIVGHNVGVDWRLLHRRCPSITPAGLIDTLRLGRHLKTTHGNGLAHLVAHHGLAEQVNTLAADSQPHRALWDAVAAAVLLTTLIDRMWPGQPTIGELAAAAALRIDGNSRPAAEAQPPLFE